MTFSLLMFPERRFPCDHAMLESVYTRALPSRGHRVTWVMKPAAGPGRGLATWNGTTVHLLAGEPAEQGFPRPWASAQRIGSAIRLARRIASRQPIDIVQVRNELAGSYAALALRAQWGVPFVYQLSFPLVEPHLIQPDGDRTRLRAQRALTSVKRIAQRRVLESADLVLAISDRMRAELIADGISPDKVMSFPLGFDAGHECDPGDGARIRRELGIEGKPTVIYVGALDRMRRLDFLLDAMLHVRRELPAAVLLLLGSARFQDDLRWLENQAAERGLEGTVRFLGAVPRAAVPRYLMAATLSVAPIPPIPAYLVSSPTKVVESLGMGVPVVANEEIPDQQSIIEESGGGTCVSYSAEAFASAIVSYLRDPAAARMAGERGREYILRTRSYESLADAIEARYDDLLASRRASTA